MYKPMKPSNFVMMWHIIDFHEKTHSWRKTFLNLFLVNYRHLIFHKHLWKKCLENYFLSNIQFIFLFESLNYESETLVESAIQRSKSFKVYHTRWKRPSPYCILFFPYILIPIKWVKSCQIFQKDYILIH